MPEGNGGHQGAPLQAEIFLDESEVFSAKRRSTANTHQIAGNTPGHFTNKRSLYTQSTDNFAQLAPGQASSQFLAQQISQSDYGNANLPSNSEHLAATQAYDHTRELTVSVMGFADFRQRIA